jgi:hypothetical protein
LLDLPCVMWQTASFNILKPTGCVMRKQV